MSNLTVALSGQSIYVDFGDYYNPNSNIEWLKATYHKESLHKVELLADHLHIQMEYEPLWQVTCPSVSGGPYFIIDSVNGVTPTSNEDLFVKLSNLRD
jgi:aminopeptidase-like protein